MSAILGLLLWNSWPSSGLWFIGFCVGIDLIAEGLGWVMLSLTSQHDRPHEAGMAVRQ